MFDSLVFCGTRSFPGLINVKSRLLFLNTSIVLEVFFVSEGCTSHVRIIIHPVHFNAVSRSFFVHSRTGILIIITGYRRPESAVHLSLYDYILASVLACDIWNVATPRV